jgi:hypothetical protein
MKRTRNFMLRIVSMVILAGSACAVRAQTAPANDNWANAIAIPSVAPPATAFSSTVGGSGGISLAAATVESTDPLITCKTQNYNAAEGQMASTVWYTYTTGAAVEYVNIKATENSFTTTNFDPVLAVWTGTPATGFHMVTGGCNDEGVPNSTLNDFARVAGLRLQANTTYNIEVAFNPNTAPAIPTTSVLRLDVQAATQITVDTNTDVVPVNFSGWSAPPAMTGNPCVNPTMPGTCSLRTAIETAAILGEQAPTAVGANGAAIIVPAGSYQLTAYNNGVTGSVTTDPQKSLNVGGGDLDIWESMGIYGAGMGQTTIIVPPNDRAFQVPGAFFTATTAPPGVAVPNWTRASRVGAILTDMTLQGPGPNVTPTPTGPNSSGLFAAGGALNALERVELTGGYTIGNGGAISAGNPLQIRDSRFTNNTAVFFNVNTTGAGGAINHQVNPDYSFLEISGSTFSGNFASSETSSGSISGGGAIVAQGELVLVNSTLSGNSTKGYGGAVLINRLGNGEPILDLRNSTIADNIADVDGNGVGYGGGVYIDAPSSLNSSVPPLPPLPTASTITNSIVANNSVHASTSSLGSNCAATPYAVGTSQVDIHASYSLTNTAGTGVCAFSGNGNIVGPDPMLLALANNGGVTQTQALQPGSQAVDAGDPNGCADRFDHILTTDQRGSGYPRPTGLRCDIGAFELIAIAAAPGVPMLDPASDTGDSNSDGLTTVTKPTFDGTCGASGDTITVVADNGATVASGTCAGGNYAVAFTVALAEGMHAISAYESSSNGPSPQSATSQMTVDLTGPAINFTSTPATYVPSSDPNAQNPEFIFTVGEGRVSTAQCTLDGATVPDDNCNTGDATYFSVPLGQHTFVVQATDVAGAVTTLQYIWQIGSPSTPAQVVLSAASDSGSSSSDGITNSDPLQFQDTCTTGDSMLLYDGVNVIGGPTICSGGAVSFSIAGLGEGSHSITLTATRGGSAESAHSAAKAITVDRTAPVLNIDGTPQSNMVSTSATFTFHTDDGSATQCQLDGGSAVACTSPQTYTGLALGAHTFTVTSADVAGNMAAPQSYGWSEIQPPASGAPMLAPSSDSGVSNSDGITNAVDTTFAGACTDGDSIQLYDGATAVGGSTLCASGVYNAMLSNPSEGAHAISMTATRNGIESAKSATAQIVIDRTAPDAPAINGNSGPADLTATLSGLAEPNATVVVYDAATSVCSAIADAQANWSCSGSLAGSGTRSLAATATDVAGNTSAASPAYSLTTLSNDRIFRNSFGN